MQSRGVQSMSRVCAGYYNDNNFVTDLILFVQYLQCPKSLDLLEVESHNKRQKK